VYGIEVRVERSNREVDMSIRAQLNVTRQHYAEYEERLRIMSLSMPQQAYQEYLECSAACEKEVESEGTCSYLTFANLIASIVNLNVELEKLAGSAMMCVVKFPE
jgi:hypothetical protein